jgi:hypothetical protein
MNRKFKKNSLEKTTELDYNNKRIGFMDYANFKLAPYIVPKQGF